MEGTGASALYSGYIAAIHMVSKCPGKIISIFLRDCSPQDSPQRLHGLHFPEYLEFDFNAKRRRFKIDEIDIENVVFKVVVDLP